MMFLKSMVKPLQVVSFFQYYQHLGKLITRYSIQNKKALYLLQYLMILEGRYGGSLPECAIV